MKNTSLLLKISIPLLLLFAVTMGFYLTDALTQTEETTYSQLAEKLIEDLNNEEHLIESIGVSNAIFIADNNQIKAALHQNDRNAAILELDSIFEKFKKSTKIQDLKVHIHTADLLSFVRSWKPNKYGDDLSGFRKTVVKVKETRQPVFDFEVGRMGLTLRSIVPVIQGAEYLGSLEFIQSFDDVAKHFEKKEKHHLLLMNSSLIYIATDLKHAPDVDHYKLCSKRYSDDFLKSAQELNLDTLQQKGYLFTGKYLYAYKAIKDMSNNSVGIHLLGMSGQEVESAVEEAKSTTLTMLVIAAASLVIILLFLILFLRGRG
jgi:methyl-accepting chemotaxis protein